MPRSSPLSTVVVATFRNLLYEDAVLREQYELGDLKERTARLARPCSGPMLEGVEDEETRLI